jgi:hypothetical protein
MLIGRQNSITIAILISFSLLIGGGWFGVQLYEDGREWRWIKEVLLEEEFIESSGKIHRWKKSASIMITADAANDTKLAREIIKEINQVLAKTFFQLKLVNKNADISVFLMPLHKLPEIAEFYGFKGSSGDRGFAYERIKDESESTAGYVFVDSKSSFFLKKALLYEEIVQVLGPGNDSDQMRDSIFYERYDWYAGSKIGDKVTSELSPIDKKLLRFLYLHLKPGDDERTVRQAYEKHWNQMK